jgi:hypothetical protein
MILFFFNWPSQAQNCKYDIDKTDPFTGRNIKSITTPFLGSWNITFVKDGDDFYAEVYLLLSGQHKDVVSPGDSMLIAMEGTKPVVLYAMESFVPKHEINGNVVKTWYRVKYSLDMDTLTKLGEGSPIAVRFLLGAAVQETEIPAKNAAKIKKASQCIKK